MNDKSIRQIMLCIQIAVTVLCLNMGPANSGQIHSVGQRSTTPQQTLKWKAHSQKILSAGDALLYRKVFQVQKTGNWKNWIQLNWIQLKLGNWIPV